MLKPRVLAALDGLLSCLAVAVLFFHFSHFVGDNSIGHNTASNLLPAIAPFKNLGVPYRDYWDIYPPGIYIFWTLFGLLFKKSLFLYKLLHLAIAGSCTFFTFRILSRMNPGRHLCESFIPASAFLVLFFSLPFQSHLLPNTMIGVFFSLWGLWVSLFSKNEKIRFLFGAFLFLFSGFIKDPFIFGIGVPIALAVFEDKEKTKSRLFLIFLGGMSALLLNYAYLISLGVLSDYQAMVAQKRVFFFAGSWYWNLFPNRIIGFLRDVFYSMFRFGLVFTVFYQITLAWVLFQGAKSRFKNISSVELGVIAFFICELMGFTLQHRIGASYNLQMIPAIILCLNALINILGRKFSFRYHALILLFLMIPQNYLFENPLPKTISGKEFISQLFTKEWNGDPLPAEIRQQIQNGDLLLLYGWGSPEVYLNAEIKPFNRFYIVHANIMGRQQEKEWAQSFIEKLPKFIVYGTGPGTDMDAKAFEERSIAIDRLLAACYTKSGEYYVLNKEFAKTGHCPAFHDHLSNFIAPQALAHDRLSP